MTEIFSFLRASVDHRCLVVFYNVIILLFMFVVTTLGVCSQALFDCIPFALIISKYL